MFEHNNPGLLQSNKDKPEEACISCFRCGICCTKYQVNLSLVEAQNISGELGLTRDKFLAEYVDPRWPGTYSFLLRHVNGACIFFRQAAGCKEATCIIHSFKPASCIDWMPGLHKRECQEGLAKYWALTVDSSGKLKGDEERIKHFQSFLQLLRNSESTQRTLC